MALSLTKSPAVESPSAIGRCHFKRYVAPNQPRIADLPKNRRHAGRSRFSLSIERPFIGYPAVVYTGKYADPVARLKQASRDMLAASAGGARGVRHSRSRCRSHRDHGRSGDAEDGQPAERFRAGELRSSLHHGAQFPAVAGEDDYAAALQIPLVYRDVNGSAHRRRTRISAADFGFAGNIDDLAEIFLPTARTVRLTLRAVCEKKPDDAAYYGLLNLTSDHEADSRYGHIIECASIARRRTSAICSSIPRRRNGCREFICNPTNRSIADGKFTTALFQQGSPALRRTSCSGSRNSSSSRTSDSPSCRRKASARSSVARAASGTRSRRTTPRSPFPRKAICLTTGCAACS